MGDCGVVVQFEIVVPLGSSRLSSEIEDIKE
jgi:hypothetical protein